MFAYLEVFHCGQLVVAQIQELHLRNQFLQQRKTLFQHTDTAVWNLKSNINDPTSWYNTVIWLKSTLCLGLVGMSHHWVVDGADAVVTHVQRRQVSPHGNDSRDRTARLRPLSLPLWELARLRDQDRLEEARTRISHNIQHLTQNSWDAVWNINTIPIVCKQTLCTSNSFNCSWGHVVILFIQSCVSQSGEPRPILAYEQLSFLRMPLSTPIMILSHVNKEPVLF